MSVAGSGFTCLPASWQGLSAHNQPSQKMFCSKMQPFSTATKCYGNCHLHSPRSCSPQTSTRLCNAFLALLIPSGDYFLSSPKKHLCSLLSREASRQWRQQNTNNIHASPEHRRTQQDLHAQSWWSPEPCFSAPKGWMGYHWGKRRGFQISLLHLDLTWLHRDVPGLGRFQGWILPAQTAKHKNTNCTWRISAFNWGEEFLALIDIVINVEHTQPKCHRQKINGSKDPVVLSVKRIKNILLRIILKLFILLTPFV